MNKNMRNFLVLCIIAASSALFADLAPTRYEGWTLSPKFESRVRMTSEVVDIYWGKVCKVKALFNLINHSDTAINMKIGFPANLTFLKASNELQRDSINNIYDFTFTLNGITLTESDIPDRQLDNREEQWYGWDCKIQPGQNKISLLYHVKPSPAYGYGWQENIYYVLHTGKFWEDKIDSAAVTVHFSQKVSAEQIHSKTTPSRFEIRDSSILWTFKSFEPTDEHNIHLQITSFDIYQKMLKLKTALANSQVDAKTKLDAAIFFAGLTYAKGINFTAPAYIDSAYYFSTIMPNLSPAELKVFKQNYGKTKHHAVGLLMADKNYNSFSSNEELQHILKSAFLRTGYYGNVEYKECWQFVELSKRLFREVVAEEPDNAIAWLAYLENAYTIHPEGCNPCKFGFSLRTGGYFQNEIAIEAYKHCPNNAKIRLWHDFAAPHAGELPDTIGKLYRHNKENVELLIERESGGGGLLPRISARDFKIIQEKYRVTDNKYIVKTDRNIGIQTKNAIVETLYGLKYYHLRLCRELKALEEGKKN